MSRCLDSRQSSILEHVLADISKQNNQLNLTNAAKWENQCKVRHPNKLCILSHMANNKTCQVTFFTTGSPKAKWNKVNQYLSKLWWIWNFFYGFQHIPQIIAFDLWPLELVENNTPVLHSLSSEGWQNFTWNSIILFKKYFFQNIKISWF